MEERNQLFINPVTRVQNNKKKDKKKRRQEDKKSCLCNHDRQDFLYCTFAGSVLSK